MHQPFYQPYQPCSGKRIRSSAWIGSSSESPLKTGKRWINRWIITVMTWINRWITFCFFPTLSVKLDSSGVWFPTVWEPRSGLPNPSPRVRKWQTKGPKRGNVDGENDDKPIGKLICSQHFQTNLYHILGYLIVSQYIPNKSHSIPLNPSIFPIRSVVYLGFITPPPRIFKDQQCRSTSSFASFASSLASFASSGGFSIAVFDFYGGFTSVTPIIWNYIHCLCYMSIMLIPYLSWLIPYEEEHLANRKC